MPYTSITLQQATDALAARLSDPGMIRWVQAELSAYIREALRTWNALTGQWRDHGVFTTTIGEPFYDLTAQIPGLLGYNVTDRDLISLIQYQLLEPATPTLWSGSEQFTLADVVEALQRRRDQFLLETGLVLTRTTQVMPPTMGGRQPLAERVITIRRAAWETTDGIIAPLRREDVWASNHFLPSWVQTPGRPPEAEPFGYSVGETPPLQIQILPPNSDTGTLDLVIVQRGSALNPVTPVLLGVPDDWAWVIRFGAMADLLAKDGLAADPTRAAYCESRWQQGITLAQATSCVWAARLNNIPIQVAALTEADDYDPLWQVRSGRPDTVLLSTGTLIALAGVPDAIYSVTLDLVRNAPVPTLLTDDLQIGSELFDTILDYAEHVAMTKEGVQGVQDTKPLLDRFMRLAGVRVAIDFASTPNLPALTAQSQQDETHTARLAQ